MVLNIISLNVRGLRDENKRRAIFQHYRPSCNVLCLQETHSTASEESCWCAEWGGKIVFSHGSSNSRGTAILFKKGFSYKIISSQSAEDGRVCSVLMNVEDVLILLVNIYGPNKDSPEFFSDICHTAGLQNDKLIIVGDFNTVMDPEIDTTSDNYPNRQSSNRLRQLMSEYVLEDAWRAQNNETKRYSWFRKNPRQASRLDFALVSTGLCDVIHNCMYITGIKTDHSAFFVGFNIEQHERGGGYWKLNTSLLYDAEFIKLISNVIKNTICTSELSAVVTWELVKRDVRTAAKKYSRMKSSEDRVVISQLTEAVTELENKFDTLNDAQHELMQASKDELEEMITSRTRGIIFRSKVRWAEEGEKNSKYFFNLEKARYNAKTCSSLLVDGSVISNPDQIIHQQKKFYQELYTADPEVIFEMNNELDNTVDRLSIGADESQFSIDEVKDAIKGMKNSSCPGSDGLPAEFYKVFWKDIGTCFYNNVVETYAEGKFSESARTGILNLIPKGNKDTRLLANLRPITLLNVDYKIVEKCVANRMIPCLCDIIHQDQKGFLPERRISCNIRKILDAVTIADEDEIDGLILSCDFMKCFDRIEFESIFKSMTYLGFSDTLIQWVKIMYTSFMLKIQNNGHFSSPITVSRSVHQGGPASNAIFICVAELLANAIRKDSNIKGLFIREILHLLSQYADDMDNFLLNDQSSFSALLQKFDMFEKNAGFKLSYDKTNVYRIGAMRKSMARLYSATSLSWANKINVLGVDIHHDEDELLNINYTKIVEKSREVLSRWCHRNLSLFGKVNVINTLISSLFVYKMMVLPAIPDRVVKTMDEIFNNFLWNGHKPKISLDILKTDRKHGGAGLSDLKRKDISLKCTWVKLLLANDYPESLVYSIIQPTLGREVWCCNVNEKDVGFVTSSTSTKFWPDVLKAWAVYHYDAVEDKDHFIWFNSLIRVAGAPFLWERQFQAGLKWVSQLYQDGRWITQEEASRTFQLSVMQLNTLKAAIPIGIKRYLHTHSDVSPSDCKFYKFMDQAKTASYVYKSCGQPSGRIEAIQKAWESELGENTMPLLKAVEKIYSTTTVQKHRSFQYRLLMRAIVTNIQLHRWKIIASPRCSFCDESNESVYHLFYECAKVKELWETARKWIEDLTGAPTAPLTFPDIVYDNVTHPRSNAANATTIVTKQYIYRQRCLKEELSCNQLKALLHKFRNTEKYIAIKNNKMSRFVIRWNAKDSLGYDEYVAEYLTNIEADIES